MAKKRATAKAELAADVRRTAELGKRIDDWVNKNGEASQCETMRPLLFRGLSNNARASSLPAFGSTLRMEFGK